MQGGAGTKLTFRQPSPSSRPSPSKRYVRGRPESSRKRRQLVKRGWMIVLQCHSPSSPRRSARDSCSFIAGIACHPREARSMCNEGGDSRASTESGEPYGFGCSVGKGYTDVYDCAGMELGSSRRVSGSVRRMQRSETREADLTCNARSPRPPFQAQPSS
jgi:hypothetical protein